MDKVLQIYLSKDMGEANSLIEDIEAYSQCIGGFAKSLIEEVSNAILAVDLSLIVWSLEQVARSCKNIMDIVINECMEMCEGFCEILQTPPSDNLIIEPLTSKAASRRPGSS